MKKFYPVALVLILILCFGAVCYQSCHAQTTPLSFTQLTSDLNRPGGGANEWSYDQNIVNIPTQGVNTQRLDRYWRFTWLDFQPGNGTSGAYDFTKFDAKIQQSINKGQKFSFGVMQQCGGCDANLQTNIGGAVMLYPTWLHTQMQSEATKDFISGGEWFPNYNSAYYLTALKNLNTAINAHILSGSYNGVLYKNVIGQIDIRGYGDFGEWTNNVFTAGNITVATGDSIISYHAHVFNTFQCVMMIATLDGGQLSNTNVPPLVGYYALTTSNAVGRLGIRRDSWGQTDGYLDQWMGSNPTVVSGYHFDTAINNRFKYAPVVGEPQDGGSAGNFNALPGQMTQYGVMSFGNGNFNNAITTTIQSNFRAASKAAGYRLTFAASGGHYTTSPAAGGAFQIALPWQNTGASPTYENWNVVFRLVSGTTVLWTGTSSFNPRLFLPSGSATTITDNFTLTSVPAGSGLSLTVSVQDPNGFRFPMPLFITTPQNPDGSYTLATGITVGSSGSNGIANAGPDQTITAPGVTSVTLSGAGSSGTLTSYSWTFISGPSTPSISTPSASSTLVTGLNTIGTYIFQLAVNGGSTARTNVIVNPPPGPASAGVNVFTTQVSGNGLTWNDGPQGGTHGIETGMKFRSTLAGYVLGMRFLKAKGDTGVHIGLIYSSTGTELARATFTSETASGWQSVSFPSAVQILANTTYVVAVFSPLGNYEDDNNYFTTPVVNSPLTGLADGTDGGNGVYIYTDSPAFPTSSYQKTNYWRDPIFSPVTSGVGVKRTTQAHFYLINPNP